MISLNMQNVASEKSRIFNYTTENTLKLTELYFLHNSLSYNYILQNI